ncbi:MAG: hypothetical protein ABW364_08760 [Rhodococcus fascians]
MQDPRQSVHLPLMVHGVDDLLQRADSYLGTSQWKLISAEQSARYQSATRAVGTAGTSTAQRWSSTLQPLHLLALLPKFFADVFLIQGVSSAVNYGLNQVRFESPVPVGTRIRGIVRLGAVDRVDECNAVRAYFTTRIEGLIGGLQVTVCTAESIVQYRR